MNMVLVVSWARTWDPAAAAGKARASSGRLLCAAWWSSGRDDEILGLLPVVSPQDCKAHHAVELRARVLERLGRVDEALVYVQEHVDGGWALSVNHVELLADMMIRYGRMTEVRALVAGRGGRYVAARLASFLAGQRNIDGAIEVLAGRVDDAIALEHVRTAHPKPPGLTQEPPF